MSNIRRFSCGKFQTFFTEVIITMLTYANRSEKLRLFKLEKAPNGIILTRSFVLVYYAPNFEKVGSILVSACAFVRPFVRSKQNSS